MELRFKVDTTINQQAVEADSMAMANVYMIAIVTEGSHEELDYLRYVARECRRRDRDINIEILFLNDLYADELVAVGHSHPKHRLAAMERWINYSDKFNIAGDERWLVCDRDRQNFHDDSYDKIVAQCSSLGINLIVSNPAFQLWLLLHFTDNVAALGLETLPTCKQQIKTIEHALRQPGRAVGYQHGHVDMAVFAPHIEAAIVNSQPYIAVPEHLRDNIGTNFANLLQSLKSLYHMSSLS